MSKRIVFCADGTWNGPEVSTGVSVTEGADDKGDGAGSKVTNVVKLFANLAGRVTPETLALANEQEKVLLDTNGELLQVAKYLHGVGDSDNAVKKVLGGMFGAGVVERIVRGYTYISRNYQPGDDIYITGFSRGAYTARALAGMIASVGLLNPAKYDVNDKEQAFRLGLAAWCKAKGITLNGSGKLTQVAGSIIGFIQNLFARSLGHDALIAGVPIKCVAVWDTVGSMGIPVYAGDARYDVFRFTDTQLSPKVQFGLHAMAVDELRRDFPITRWDERDGITQVWFTGAHADVGGGYLLPESGLSDIALDWMMRKLAEVGVKLATPLTYSPVTTNFRQPIHTPWEDFAFKLAPRAPRAVLVKDALHPTVVERWDADANYRPGSLNAAAQVGLDKMRTG